MSNSKRILRPDVIIEFTREVKARRVAYDDVARRVEWIADDHCLCPWEDCDGWEHSFERVDYLPFDDQRQAVGYVCRSSREGGSGIITLDNGGDGWGVRGYWRGRGASKQVAEEMVAENRRRSLAQLVQWYENGWYYFGCVCKWGEYENSCWGFLSDNGNTDDEYFREAEVDIIGEVVAEMETDGYIVTGKPSRDSVPAHNYRVRRSSAACVVSTREGRKPRAWRKAEKRLGRRPAVVSHV